MKYTKILFAAIMSMAALGFTGCSDDNIDYDKSVIVTPNAPENDLDRWITRNITSPYNIQIQYRLEDIEGDMNYYLVPADFQGSVMMSHLLKYLCLETYNEAAGTDFTCRYFPKLFCYCGDWKYKNNGTIVLATAEGGRKIYLCGLNYLPGSIDNISTLNSRYFKTIHHEFTHILNQTYPIPADYQLITGSGYVADLWSESPYNVGFLTRGFISSYSQHSYTEDFAEMMSIYITNSASYWESQMEEAGDGASAIQQKLDIVRDYMKTNFNIDIDELRNILQRRQSDIANGAINLTDLTLK
ncbi:MAG: putative zinc-binding metallopeptidase [Muribaculaceae bacterium]|nr:putative zinc-binding metallopeptidase [Muribaculaceae bacterium]